MNFTICYSILKFPLQMTQGSSFRS